MPDLAAPKLLEVVQRCTICGGPHGRPLLPGTPLLASVAYAEPWVIVAVAHRDDADAIGIDLELEGAAPDLTALFAPQDPPDLRGWTAIEAALKADGRGLMVPPDQVRVDAEGGRATVPGGPDLHVFPVHADPGMIATLALSPARGRPRGEGALDQRPRSEPAAAQPPRPATHSSTVVTSAWRGKTFSSSTRCTSGS